MPCEETDDNINPAHLRSRPRYYCDLADEEPDREKAALYREIAEAFEKDADARERRKRDPSA
jgi:hypothetical protein